MGNKTQFIISRAKLNPGGFYYDARYLYTESGTYERRYIKGLEEVWLEEEEESGPPHN